MKHKVSIRTLWTEPGCVEKLPDLIEELGVDRILLVCDRNTWEVAGEKVHQLLTDCGKLQINVKMFETERLIPDETALGSLIFGVKPDTQLMIAIGSGTINDLTRYASYRLVVPYLIVATAPSMDGYASTVSPLVVAGVKTTYNAVYPMAIVSDPLILTSAPGIMTQAGFGDILGKYTALADWSLASILNGERSCERVRNIVKDTINRVVESPLDEAVLMDALVVSGIAIGMMDSSRPASGEEHHLSHTWEGYALQRKDHRFSHGNFVGAGTWVAAKAYEFASGLDVKHLVENDVHQDFSEELWEQRIRKGFGVIAEVVLSFKRGSMRFDRQDRQRQAERILEVWERLRAEMFTEVPSGERIKSLLVETGCVWNPLEFGMAKEELVASIIAAKDIRNRYGILQLLEDLGVLQQFAEELVTDLK